MSWGVYRPQAEIAALHSTARTPIDTDWVGIVAWYDLLVGATASPVVALNRAVAVGMRDGPVAGLAVLDAVVDQHHLDDTPEVAAIRADLLRRSGDSRAALEVYRAAHEVARTEAVRSYLRRRIDELG